MSDKPEGPRYRGVFSKGGKPRKYRGERYRIQKNKRSPNSQETYSGRFHQRGVTKEQMSF